MKSIKSVTKRTFIAVLMIATLLFTASIDSQIAATTMQPRANQITIVFSHDMHSHDEGFPKIATVIDEQRAENEATFVFDGGDFSMGTPYHATYKTEAADLRLMGAVGYDAVAIGNHEFDFRSKGLAAMLTRAKSSGDRVPDIAIANIDWQETLADEKLAEDGKNLQKALQDYGYVDRYKVYERGGAKVAVFGIFGDEADSYAPESGTKFTDQIETAESIVEEIESNEQDIDLIVCISHSGTNPEDPEDDEYEDVMLAKEVDGIDLIISGHSHTYMDQPVVVDDTVIASCGQYNDNIGIVSFVEGNDGYEYTGAFEQKSLDDSVANDEEIEAKVAEFKALVDEGFFSKYGYMWDQVIANNQQTFTPIDEFGIEAQEDSLGNIISDSYIYGVMQAEGDSYEKVDVAVVPLGVVRGSFAKGEITAGDAFNVLSIGTGADGEPGYPLVSVYLTGKELKLVAEVDATVSGLMSAARLYSSGLTYKINPKRMILNKSYDIALADNFNADGAGFAEIEIEDDKMYRVVADLYSAQMLGTVNSMSKGVLSLVPKDKDGNPIEDYEACIIKMQDGRELKEWYALATYIDSFPENEVPDRYNQSEGRKEIVDSFSPAEVLTDTNQFFWIGVGVLVIFFMIIFAIARKLARRSRRRRV